MVVNVNGPHLFCDLNNDVIDTSLLKTAKNKFVYHTELTSIKSLF